MYLIIQLVVFFSILPIDVNRKRKFLIPANEVGAPENPKILKKTFYSIGITTIIFTIICLLMKYDYLDLENMDGMKKEAELVRDLGFTGKGSVHPKQIDILNDIFTPSEEEISKAKRIVDQFNASDTGLVVIDGKLIEKPVLREMQRKILIADKINQN